MTADRVWTIPSVRLRIVSFLPYSDALQVMLVDRHSMDSAIKVLYHDVDVREIEVVAKRRPARERLLKYNSAVRTLNLSPTAFSATILEDVGPLDRLILDFPNLQTIKGTHHELFIHRHYRSPMITLPSLKVEKLDKIDALSWDAIKLLKAIRPKGWSLAWEIEFKYDIRIKKHHDRSPASGFTEDLIECWRSKTGIFAHTIDTLRINRPILMEPLIEFFTSSHFTINKLDIMLPNIRTGTMKKFIDACSGGRVKNLTIRSSGLKRNLPDINETLDSIRKLDLSTFDEIKIPAKIPNKPDRSESAKAKRWLNYVNHHQRGNGKSSSSSSSYLKNFTVCFLVHPASTAENSNDIGCSFPCISDLAENLLALAGPNCKYSIQVESIIDESGNKMLGRWLTGMLNEEIIKYREPLQGQKQGWSRRSREQEFISVDSDDD